jgi:hypothetical protein
MINAIKEKIETFNRTNDVHQYRMILDAADLFIKNYAKGVTNKDELDLGVNLLREIIGITMIGSLREYESDYDLEREIRHKKIKVFKLCIPSSHEELRGLTEMLLGMKENAVG